MLGDPDVDVLTAGLVAVDGLSTGVTAGVRRGHDEVEEPARRDGAKPDRKGRTVR
jgi:hypothetical protein